MLSQLDTENADLNLTSLITVLTHTPSVMKLCRGHIKLGDGSKNLDGSGGDFEFTISIGGQTIQPNPQTITFGTEVRSAVWTVDFMVPANEEVILKVKSPNADVDVDVTAYLYDIGVSAQEIADAGKLAPAAGAPAAGSQDAHLDTIEANSATIISDKAEPGDDMGLTGSAVTDIDTELTTEHGAGSWQTGVAGGIGAIKFVYFVENAATGYGLADVDVWVTTDVTGNNVVASGQTDQAGNVTFYLDAGTVYMWHQKSGFSFTNPVEKVVA